MAAASGVVYGLCMVGLPVARAAGGVELVACGARLLSSGSPAILVCGTGGTRLRHGRAEAKMVSGFVGNPF